MKSYFVLYELFLSALKPNFNRVGFLLQSYLRLLKHIPIGNCDHQKEKFMARGNRLLHSVSRINPSNQCLVQGKVILLNELFTVL